MSSHTAVSGKSPLAQGHASRRGRGTLLIITVIALLIGVAAWTTVYTRAVATAPNEPTLPEAAKNAAPDQR